MEAGHHLAQQRRAVAVRSVPVPIPTMKQAEQEEESPTGEVVASVGWTALHRSLCPLATHAYMISLRGARTLLEILERDRPVSAPIDVFMRDALQAGSTLAVNVKWAELYAAALGRAGMRESMRRPRVSLKDVHLLRKSIGLTYKQVSQFQSEKDWAAVRAYTQEYLKRQDAMDATALVFLDEFSVVLNEHPRRAWGVKGREVRLKFPKTSKARTDVVAAIRWVPRRADGTEEAEPAYFVAIYPPRKVGDHPDYGVTLLRHNLPLLPGQRPPDHPEALAERDSEEGQPWEAPTLEMRALFPQIRRALLDFLRDPGGARGDGHAGHVKTGVHPDICPGTGCPPYQDKENPCGECLPSGSDAPQICPSTGCPPGKARNVCQECDAKGSENLLTGRCLDGCRRGLGRDGCGRCVPDWQGVTPTPSSDGSDWCAACDVPRLLNEEESTMVCTECGSTVSCLLQTPAQCAYGWQPYKKSSAFAYKRASHLQERLNQLQARENFNVPEEVYQRVYEEFRKNRKLDQIRPDLIRATLKKLKLSKLYEHVGIIYSRLTGTPPPRLSKEQEDRIKQMFSDIQEPFERACPSKRKNFLSYSFVLHKICELLGLDDFLPYFPLLKSREKLHQQDGIWRLICADLGWEFIKSV
eukprot:tig00000492_g1449.t1